MIFFATFRATRSSEDTRSKYSEPLHERHTCWIVPDGPRADAYADFVLPIGYADLAIFTGRRAMRTRSPASVSAPSVLFPLRAHRRMASATRFLTSCVSPPGVFAQTRSSATSILASVRRSKLSSIISTLPKVLRCFQAKAFSAIQIERRTRSPPGKACEERATPRRVPPVEIAVFQHFTLTADRGPTNAWVAASTIWRSFSVRRSRRASHAAKPERIPVQNAAELYARPGENGLSGYLPNC